MRNNAVKYGGGNHVERSEIKMWPFKLQNLADVLISKLNEAEQRINELENILEKITQNGPTETTR